MTTFCVSPTLYSTFNKLQSQWQQCSHSLLSNITSPKPLILLWHPFTMHHIILWAADQCSTVDPFITMKAHMGFFTFSRSLRLSLLIQKHAFTQKSFLGGQVSQLFAVRSGESERSKTPKQISCWWPETFTWQFVLNSSDIVIYCNS